MSAGLTHLGGPQKISGDVMSAARELRQDVQHYLDKRISLRELEERIVARSPLLLADVDGSARRLYELIELYLSEMSAGVRAEREVRRSLRKFISEPGDALPEPRANRNAV